MKYYNIKVTLTDEDLDMLRRDITYFDWTFPTEDKNVSVNIKLMKVTFEFCLINYFFIFFIYTY